ncbi:hypothetical protein JTE90_008409 [Oedothorax gibbosus]|uniref:Uncharacterized protein n=1 Tax=Oedothorax gibbosus TaxID=931172 RepID=A0AAV6V2W4_9ARAC|nr:hypothetical protein JTE90_008409 [Oedothorax gibbosus]
MMFWVAGGIPLELKKLRKAFTEKSKKRALLGFALESTVFEKLQTENEDFELSGCGILIFRRSSILGVLGNILTYGLLVKSIEIRQVNPLENQLKLMIESSKRIEGKNCVSLIPQAPTGD